MTMIILDGKKVAEQIKTELKEKVDKLIAENKKVPGLVTIMVGDNPASHSYVNSKSKSSTAIGMLSKVEKLPAETTEDELIELVEKYNYDKNYHGILVQLPLPKHINEDRVIMAINPDKDVDGFHPISVGKLVIGQDTFLPCTPAGIQELFKRYNIETTGKHVVVVGRSNIVGKPITNIMFQKKQWANSIVTICHTAANDLSVYTKQADILIAAIGQPNFIKADMVKDGVVVIDVGINRVEDANLPKGYRIVGDVDFENVAPKSSYITPVPGGVGLLTVAMLLSNTYKAYAMKEGIK
ncbi:MAG: bifunctional methylenetetrahydrofolate dehydrogenase/methenyltetrahydrofolate cyclohydrolase FolD [Ignavibacteriales bacterium]|nr:MAG: bifunctional methylenetetrahydrofolate dehydrogenase/methenyltetrahydrofolate cyclohydrolase FolD [Ignavibacteriales bacterium]